MTKTYNYVLWKITRCRIRQITPFYELFYYNIHWDGNINQLQAANFISYKFCIKCRIYYKQECSLLRFLIFNSLKIVGYLDSRYGIFLAKKCSDNGLCTKQASNEAT